MVREQNQPLRQAIFDAPTMAECRRLILEVLAIHFSFLPARTLRDFTPMQMPFSMSKLKTQRIGLNSVRRFPFPTLSVGGSRYQAKSGTSRSLSFAAMRWEIFGQ
jgi:hypothetical protein